MPFEKAAKSRIEDRPRTLAIDGFYIGYTDDGEIDLVFTQFKDPNRNLKDEIALGAFRLSQGAADDLVTAINDARKDFKESAKKRK